MPMSPAARSAPSTPDLVAIEHDPEKWVPVFHKIILSSRERANNMNNIDLNCDLGEGFGAWEMGNDAAMIELATSVNIACGFHAGDADIMRQTVELAKARGVSVGAHPGYRDLHGFGRRPVRD